MNHRNLAKLHNATGTKSRGFQHALTLTIQIITHDWLSNCLTPMKVTHTHPLRTIWRPSLWRRGSSQISSQTPLYTGRPQCKSLPKVSLITYITHHDGAAIEMIELYLLGSPGGSRDEAHRLMDEARKIEQKKIDMPTSNRTYELIYKIKKRYGNSLHDIERQLQDELDKKRSYDYDLMKHSLLKDIKSMPLTRSIKFWYVHLFLLSMCL